ncbi:hypothetical protein PVK06_012573 [Gossypium arboreum]|uniref:RNase H type-1 domain-containing protein n=1 Tax=Gossypium arboreum TaxID=29729 RepID=A0ABR0QBV7_GOSAR|nr:hypothetical protein PVK06_012573 [Gossypium arboreum]
MAFQVQSLKSCSGIIIRGSRCQVIGLKAIVNEHMPSIFTAEALACLQAIRLGINLRIRDVVVKGGRPWAK